MIILLIWLFVDFDEVRIQTDNLSVSRFYTGDFHRRTIRRTKIEFGIVRLDGHPHMSNVRVLPLGDPSQ